MHCVASIIPKVTFILPPSSITIDTALLTANLLYNAVKHGFIILIKPILIYNL